MISSASSNIHLDNLVFSSLSAFPPFRTNKLFGPTTSVGAAASTLVDVDGGFGWGLGGGEGLRDRLARVVGLVLFSVFSLTTVVVADGEPPRTFRNTLSSIGFNVRITAGFTSRHPLIMASSPVDRTTSSSIT